MRTLDAKTCSLGLIEVKEMRGGWYGLYLNGQLREQSADLNYILGQFDAYR